MFTRGNIKDINDYSALLVNSTFPGLFVIETIYQKGLFSGGISSVYDFILLILWSMIISIPFGAMNELSLRFDKIEFNLPDEKIYLKDYFLLPSLFTPACHKLYVL